MDRLLPGRVPDPADVVVRGRQRSARTVVLAVDVSGSMRGERIRTAAATVGALAGDVPRDRLAVVAFWADAAVLQPLGEPRPAEALVDALLRIPARGLTNIEFPLEVSARLLEGLAADDARVILLSDCLHNAGPDPRVPAARLPRLDVMLDQSGAHDLQLAQDLARAGRGRLARVRTHREVAQALNRALAP